MLAVGGRAASAGFLSVGRNAILNVPKTTTAWMGATTAVTGTTRKYTVAQLDNTCMPDRNNHLRVLSSSSSSAAAPEEEANRHQIFALILGKPGGGKGTISEKILQDFPFFHHFSSGDLLRSHVREATSVGIEASRYMNEGKFVPDDLMIRLVVEEAHPQLEQGKSLLLDGFPRTAKQAEALEQTTSVDLVINLDIPTETIVERIADRWIHPASGRVYSYSYKPPKIHGKDDVTGETLVQRPDDQPEKVRARLVQYDQETTPLIEYYQKKGVLHSFQGTKSDVIYPKVKDWLESIFSDDC